jgi:hypothetical protein
MRTMKIIALSAILVFTTASLAMACDGKKAESASAKAACAAHADAEVAVATAAAEDAPACAGKAANAAVKTASAKCSSMGGDADMAMMANAISVETVRMPSGSMAVFYNGSCAMSTGALQASAAKELSEFSCPLAQNMAADENVTIEMAKTEHGVMILVTAKDEATLDKYEAQYSMATSTEDESSEE